MGVLFSYLPRFVQRIYEPYAQFPVEFNDKIVIEVSDSPDDTIFLRVLKIPEALIGWDEEITVEDWEVRFCPSSATQLFTTSTHVFCYINTSSKTIRGRRLIVL